MRFRFRLAAIERIRASFERREKLRLMLVTARLAEIQQQISHLDAERRAAQEELENRLAMGLRGGEMHLYAMQAQARELLREGLHREAREAERHAQAQQVAYARARREHEILQRLRQRAYNLHLAAERRREQQWLDDMFLQTRPHGQAR
jgi:flagellar export protein FliJ